MCVDNIIKINYPLFLVYHANFVLLFHLSNEPIVSFSDSVMSTTKNILGVKQKLTKKKVLPETRRSLISVCLGN